MAGEDCHWLTGRIHPVQWYLNRRISGRSDSLQCRAPEISATLRFWYSSAEGRFSFAKAGTTSAMDMMDVWIWNVERFRVCQTPHITSTHMHWVQTIYKHTMASVQQTELYMDSIKGNSVSISSLRSSRYHNSEGTSLRSCAMLKFAYQWYAITMCHTRTFTFLERSKLEPSYEIQEFLVRCWFPELTVCTSCIKLKTFVAMRWR